MVRQMATNQSKGKDFAAEVVARVYSGQMTEAEERSIESWLQVDPEHRAEFQKMLDLWDAAGDLNKPTIPSESERTRSRPVRKRFLYGIAATVLALAGLPLLMQSFDAINTELKRYETVVGEIREIELVDGSHVTLNTNTQLLIDFSETERRIILNHGEVFFDIENETSRPLTVSAGDQVITVLGTSFSVNWHGREVTVAVVEGRVAVQAEGTEPTAVEYLMRLNDASSTSADSGDLKHGVVLLAGEVAQISRATEPVIETVSRNTERYQSWRFGYVRFDNEPLSTVIEEINRYSSIQLAIEDPGIADMKVSGVFRTSDIDNAISNLELIFPIKVLDRGDHYLIVSANGV